MELNIIILYTVLLFFGFLILVFFSMIQKKDYNDTLIRQIQETQNFLIKKTENSVNILRHELNVLDSPELMLFLKAMINNLKYLTVKKYQFSIIKTYCKSSTPKRKLTDFIKSIENSFVNDGKPVYSDYSHLIDKETLRLYENLGRAFIGLGNTFPSPDINSYNVDLSDKMFFYLKVADLEIPYFLEGDESDTHVYIYPMTIIFYEKDSEFKSTGITNSTITLQDIDNPTIRLDTSYGSIIITAITAVAAMKFVTAFEDLKMFIMVKETLSNTKILS